MGRIARAGSSEDDDEASARSSGLSAGPARRLARDARRWRTARMARRRVASGASNNVNHQSHIYR
ncbi:hypothetical protein N9D08_00830 [bacterium]|nr:hypothetical protein [bacterium]